MAIAQETIIKLGPNGNLIDITFDGRPPGHKGTTPREGHTLVDVETIVFVKGTCVKIGNTWYCK